MLIFRIFFDYVSCFISFNNQLDEYTIKWCKWNLSARYERGIMHKIHTYNIWVNEIVFKSAIKWHFKPMEKLDLIPLKYHWDVPVRANSFCFDWKMEWFVVLRYGESENWFKLQIFKINWNGNVLYAFFNKMKPNSMQYYYMITKIASSNFHFRSKSKTEKKNKSTNEQI